MLANLVIDRAPGRLGCHESLLNGIKRVQWTPFLRKLRGAEYWRLDDAIDANLLLLDDIGASSDSSFSLEQLYSLLESRIRKWTVITSNLTLEEIGQRMDTRIASRLIRHNNVCVEVDTVDFSLR